MLTATECNHLEHAVRPWTLRAYPSKGGPLRGVQPSGTPTEVYWHIEYLPARYPGAAAMAGA